MMGNLLLNEFVRCTEGAQTCPNCAQFSEYQRESRT